MLSKIMNFIRLRPNTDSGETAFIEHVEPKNLIDEATYYRLRQAMTDRDVDEALRIVEGFPHPNLLTDMGWTALHIAVSCDAPLAIKPLVKRGVELEALNDFGYTALHLAATEEYQSVVHCLLDAGANPNARIRGGGGTPLHRSLYRPKNSEIIEALIRHGADVNAATESGVTPLDMAIDYAGQPEIELLLMRGANPNARIDGATNLHRLASGGLPIDVFELLVKAGADVTAKTPDGLRPIDIAMSRGRNDLMAVLDPTR